MLRIFGRIRVGFGDGVLAPDFAVAAMRNQLSATRILQHLPCGIFGFLLRPMQTCRATGTMALVDPLPVFVSASRPVLLRPCCLFLPAQHNRRSFSTGPTPTPPLYGRGVSVVLPPHSPPWPHCLPHR